MCLAEYSDGMSSPTPPDNPVEAVNLARDLLAAAACDPRLRTESLDDLAALARRVNEAVVTLTDLTPELSERTLIESSRAVGTWTDAVADIAGMHTASRSASWCASLHLAALEQRRRCATSARRLPRKQTPNR